mmetsp:Transcript_85760/g.135448  ORF Transcript_85760/g.135448 Transcript_85760/m.135448 type:complete len:223 (+) Transcript_85760:55-723(+)
MGCCSSKKFKVVFEKCSDDVLGIDMMEKDGDILIARVKQAGLFPDWNERNPEARVRDGDLVVSVNGCTDNFWEKVSLLQGTGIMEVVVKSTGSRANLPQDRLPMAMPMQNATTAMADWGDYEFADHLAGVTGEERARCTVEKSFIDTLPRVVAGNCGVTECSICLDEMSCETCVVRLPCSHCFHEECIEKWLTEKSHACPVCNAAVDSRVSPEAIGLLADQL